MKKYLLGIFSLVLAIGLSSFATSFERTTTLYYLDGNQWKTVPSSVEICPAGTVEQCELIIDDENQLIFTQPNPSFPYMRN